MELRRRIFIASALGRRLFILLRPVAWLTLMFGVSVPIAAIAACPSVVSPAQYLRCIEAPVYSNANSLPRLSRWGWWGLAVETRKELAASWGYALEFGPYLSSSAVDAAIKGVAGSQAEILSVAKSDPERFPLSVTVDRSFKGLDLPSGSWVRDKKGDLMKAPERDRNRDFAMDEGKIWSPEAPLDLFSRIGSRWAEPINQLAKLANVAIILNGGEYALTVPGFGRAFWEKDPSVLKAKGGKSWSAYVSEQKGKQEKRIADAIRHSAPESALLIYYHTGSEMYRRVPGAEMKWGYSFDSLKTSSDLPANPLYYGHYNSGWSGENDLLTATLNVIGFQIARGSPTSYNWYNGGWSRSGGSECPNKGCISDQDAYVGYLKATFAAGSIGGVAGYFSKPEGGFDVSFERTRPPAWLTQLVALSDVQATWSYLSCFNKRSDLVAGSRKHRFSSDQPAYELQERQDGSVRVVARKLRREPIWLVVAWAPTGGDEKVQISLGSEESVELAGSLAGRTYLIDRSSGALKITDLDGGNARPTRDSKILGRLKGIEARFHATCT